MSVIRVRRGDSPMGLAARFTGDPMRIRELVAANPHKPRNLIRGMLTFQGLATGETLIAPGSWLVKQFGRVSISRAQVAAHVMLPPALVGTIWDSGSVPNAPKAPPAAVIKPGGFIPKGPQFKPLVFQQQIVANSGQVVGCATLMRQNGVDVNSFVSGWARRPGDLRQAAGQPWSLDTPQDVGSVSKLWTAAAMVHLLRARFPGEDALDRAILPFLPSYWNAGPNVERITFRLLLQHKTGLGYDSQGTGPADFEYMKSQIAAGASSWPNGFVYKNVNYSLCRVLLSTLQSNLDPKWVSASGDWVETDKTWDLVSIRSLEGYIKDMLFAPAGVIGPELTRRFATAYAYTYPPGSPWDSGNLSVWAGAGGWHMTAREVLDVLAYLRRGPFLPPGIFDSQVLGLGLGLDGTFATPLGNAWTKGGILQHSTDGQMVAASLQTEQAALFIFPEGLELAMLVNSPWGRGNQGLQGQILLAFTRSIS